MSKIKLLLFILYNFLYTFFMMGTVNRFLYFLFLFLFILSCIIDSIKQKKFKFGKHNLFYNDFKNIFLMFFMLFIISIGFQFYNHDFQKYLFVDIIYLITPLITSFFWINSVDENEVNTYFYIIIIRYIIQFFLLNFNNLSLFSILSISWNNTKSSVFESSYAHDYLFLEIICLYKRKPGLAFICLLFCLLSFKRVSFILSSFVFLIYILSKKYRSSQSKKVNNKLILFFCFFISIFPYIMLSLSIGNGAELLQKLTGFDVVSFSTGRINLIRFVYYNIPYFNGLGSSINFMESLGGVYKQLGSMHCDILRLFWEVTEFGVILFIFTLGKTAKKNRTVFLMFIYLCVLISTSHCLRDLSLWLIFYMFAASTGYDAKEE